MACVESYGAVVNEEIRVINATNYDLNQDSMVDIIRQAKKQLDYGNTVTAFVLAYGIVKLVDIKKGYSREYGSVYVIDYHFENPATDMPMITPEDYDRAEEEMQQIEEAKKADIPIPNNLMEFYDSLNND